MNTKYWKSSSEIDYAPIEELDKRESTNRYVSYALPDSKSDVARTSFYMSPALQQYIQYHANKNDRSTKSRDSTNGPHGIPIHTGGSSVQYGNQAPSSTHSSASYSYPILPNPGGYGPVYPPEYDYHDDGKEKTKGVALAIALPLALVLGPLAFLGIVAIVNFRAIMTVGVIRSLCTNDNFASTYGSLCNVINNIGKRSLLPWDEAGDWLGLSKLINPEYFLKMMERLHAPELNEMDDLKD